MCDTHCFQYSIVTLVITHYIIIKNASMKYLNQLTYSVLISWFVYCHMYSLSYSYAIYLKTVKRGSHKGPACYLFRHCKSLCWNRVERVGWKYFWRFHMKIQSDSECSAELQKCVYYYISADWSWFPTIISELILEKAHLYHSKLYSSTGLNREEWVEQWKTHMLANCII